MFYEGTYQVDSRDIDPAYHCRPSGLLGMLQEAATMAACDLHASRDEMIQKYNVIWMLARIWFRLDAPLLWGDGVTVRTCHRPARGASLYRDFDLFVGDKPVGEAVSIWVLADRDTHKLARLPKLAEFAGTDGGALCKERLLPKLHLPEYMHPAGSRDFRYSDTDVNSHVNNVKYADFICDAIHLERLKEQKFVSSLHVSYLAECLPGETVALHTAQQDGLWYVHGVDGDGKSRFDGSLGLTETTP